MSNEFSSWKDETFHVLPTRTQEWRDEIQITRGALANVQFNLIEDIQGQMIARLTAKIVTASETVVYPANWLEATWERFAPMWAQKRWPPKYTTVGVDLLFPSLAARQTYGPMILKVKKEKA